MLIAICGIDGAGKTTQIQMLKEEFEKKTSVYITRQPTNFYRSYDRFRKYVNDTLLNTKELLYELALLSAADRMRHYNQEIVNNNNNVVICDRFIFSSYAYFTARGVDDIEWLKEINKWSKEPDFTFYLDIPPEKALQRIVTRDGKSHKSEEKDMELMNRVRKCYLEQPWGARENYFIIDADREAQYIHDDIVKIIKEIENKKK